MKLASSRLDPVKPSASAWVSQAAKEAKARGEDVIDLGLGEPDFDTPSHIIEAAHAAALRGETRYPPTNGTLEMRQAVVDKMAREAVAYGASGVTCRGWCGLYHGRMHRRFRRWSYLKRMLRLIPTARVCGGNLVRSALMTFKPFKRSLCM